MTWQTGVTEAAQDRASGLLRWAATRLPPRDDKRSQASLERCRAIQEAEARQEGRWHRLRVDTVRPDGCRVTSHVRCSAHELPTWRRAHRRLMAERYEAVRGLCGETPRDPPERVPRREMAYTQWRGDSVDGVYAWALAAWQRRYLCDTKPARPAASRSAVVRSIDDADRALG